MTPIDRDATALTPVASDVTEANRITFGSQDHNGGRAPVDAPVDTPASAGWDGMCPRRRLHKPFAGQGNRMG
ncbi:hypothetical protein GCM10012286_70350 [Streptomyces lasiicapitis]|uniref:Uncharacterized protein n=1 Tax=Streptomyces lasiicapitis TaxID=1923961 RepID=A0ABQ2MUM5_9ACTN|nr:hypothetical protein GCM10012286_70350 [Streptomyces lasiicapitis]